MKYLDSQTPLLDADFTCDLPVDFLLDFQRNLISIGLPFSYATDLNMLAENFEQVMQYKNLKT